MCKSKESKGLYDRRFFVIDAHKKIPMIANKYVHSIINVGTISKKKSLVFQGGSTTFTLRYLQLVDKE